MQLQRLCGFKLFFKKLELNHHELQSCGVIIFGQNIYLLILFFYARTKYIKIDYHFVRERISRKLLKINFVSSRD
jgi:hypothetical protein